MNKKTVNTFIKWLPTISFAVVIMCSPVNVWAGEILYNTSGNSILDSSLPIAGDSNFSSIFKGVYPDFSDLKTSGTYALPLDMTFIYTGYGNGDYFFCPYDGTYTSCKHDNYLPFTFTGGTLVQESFDSTATRLISFSPSDETVATTSEISLSWYINAEDFENNSTIRYSLFNLRCNSTLVGIGGIDTCSPSYTISATTSGLSGYSTTTTYEYQGIWDYHVYMQIPDFCVLGLCYQGSIEDELTGSFTVASTTLFDTFVETITTSLDDLSSITSTSTIESIRNSCNPISSDVTTLFLNPSFDLLDCTWLLFLPNDNQIREALNQIKDGFITRFPIGYLTDFISIVSSSSTIPLAVIDTNLPSGLGLGNPHIRLDLTNSLDSILYASSSSLFSTGSTSATSTLYQITSTYWNYFVYISVFLYLLNRILGSHLIPKLKSK